jgi:hypothetical protein
MTDECLQARLVIDGYADSDAQERASLASELEQILLQTSVDDVSRPTGTPPDGAKGTAVEWAQLIVTGLGSLPAFIAALRGWLSRKPGSSITVEIDGDKLTLREPTAAERDELVQAWMSRHGG